MGLLGRVRASRARVQNTAPAFARFARETEPGAALRLEGAERKSLSSAGRAADQEISWEDIGISWEREDIVF